MSRTVAALYDQRADAEFARARMLAELKAKSPRIIDRGTIAAVDGLDFSRAEADSYRDGLREGAHLLVAEVPEGTNVDSLVALLKASLGRGDEPPDEDLPDVAQGFYVAEPGEVREERPPERLSETPAREQVEEAPQPTPVEPLPRVKEEASEPRVAAPAEAVAEPAKVQVPAAGEALRTGPPDYVRGGAVVRTVARDSGEDAEAPLDEGLTGSDPGRQHRQEEIADAGLFKDRCVEVAEMREEPVVTKVAVVREELVISKRVDRRTETIRDTVRHTSIEVEDLPAD